MHTAQEVHEVGADELVARWPLAGPAIVRSGYQSVQAHPAHLARRGLRRAQRLPRRTPVGFEDQQAECRALADAVTLLIVSATLDDDHLAVRPA